MNQRYSLFLHEELDELSKSFTITDPSISGHPIVFASSGFLKMSGYSKEEVMGKNGRVFQGPRDQPKVSYGDLLGFLTSYEGGVGGERERKR